MLGWNDPELGAERPRNWGGTTAFGADVGRIDSGADRPVPIKTTVDTRQKQTEKFTVCIESCAIS